MLRDDTLHRNDVLAPPSTDEVFSLRTTYAEYIVRLAALTAVLSKKDEPARLHAA